MAKGWHGEGPTNDHGNLLNEIHLHLSRQLCGFSQAKQFVNDA